MIRPWKNVYTQKIRKLRGGNGAASEVSTSPERFSDCDSRAFGSKLFFSNLWPSGYKPMLSGLFRKSSKPSGAKQRLQSAPTQMALRQETSSSKSQMTGTRV